MFCKECGRKSENAGSFCSSCGAKLVTPVQEEPVETQVKQIENQVKQKTKLGISVGLFGATLYFMGLISIIPLVVMAGYVLLFEESEWLKKVAVKAVGIVVIFSVVSALVGLLGGTHSFFHNLFVLFRADLSLDWLDRIVLIFRAIASIIQTIILLLFGFMALIQGEEFNMCDSIIGKNM